MQWLKPHFLSLTTNPKVNRSSIFSEEIVKHAYEHTNCRDLLSARKMSVDRLLEYFPLNDVLASKEQVCIP